MKVKIQNGRLVIEEDDSKHFFNITTPHGHTFCLSNCYGFPNFDSSLTRRPLVDWAQLREDELKYIREHSELAPYIWIGYGNTDKHMIYNISRETWILEPLINGTHVPRAQIINCAIRHIEQHLINRILEYDRECENTKYLRIIGTFCEHLLTRPQILDHFSQISLSVTDEKSNATSKVSDASTNKVSESNETNKVCTNMQK